MIPIRINSEPPSAGPLLNAASTVATLQRVSYSRNPIAVKGGRDWVSSQREHANRALRRAIHFP